MNLVRGDLLALPAPPHDDAEVGVSAGDRPSHRGTDRRVIDGLLGVGAQIDDLVALVDEVLGEVRLEGVSRVIRTEGHSHARILSRGPWKGSCLASGLRR